MAVITPGVAALGPEAVERIVKTIAVFDDFCRANDPYEEHDFGSFEADGHMIMFKIDYLDRDLSMHSPDPADPSVTQRIITIMFAEVIAQFGRVRAWDDRGSRPEEFQSGPANGSKTIIKVPSGFEREQLIARHTGGTIREGAKL